MGHTWQNLKLQGPNTKENETFSVHERHIFKKDFCTQRKGRKNTGLEHFFFKRRPKGETNLQNKCKNTIKINYCTYIEKRLKAPKVPKKKSKTKTTSVPKTFVKNDSMSKRKIIVPVPERKNGLLYK